MCPGDYEVLIDDASFCPPVVLNFSIADIEVGLIYLLQVLRMSVEAHLHIIISGIREIPLL